MQKEGKNVKKTSEQIDMTQLREMEVPAFAYELLREVLIPDILGRDSSSMLYWAGKSLARKYPAESIEDLIAFFSAAGFGTLSLEHKKKDEMEFSLESELIKTRFKAMKEPSFQLEAGFLAQQMQRMNKQITETYEQVKKRADKVVFTVKWDYKDMEFENE